MLYLILYSIATIAFVYFIERGKANTQERFLAANRNVSGFIGSMSIASSWIWAPAIFVSTQVGFQWGYSGLFWFVVPNIFALMIFAPFAAKIRDHIPNGYSYLELIEKKNGKFREVQLAVQIAVQIVSYTIQITAGAELLSFVSGTPYWTIAFCMATAPLLYTLISGLSSSVLTDAVQYVIILLAIVCIYFGLPMDNPTSYLALNSFNPFDPKMLVGFGIASGLTLVFGIFADHQQWQRAFAIKKEEVRKTYLQAGLLHGVVTFSLGTLGVILFNYGYSAGNPQIVGGEFISSFMHPAFSVIFVFMALCGLCSTLDSALCAFGSLYATQIKRTENPVRDSRIAMIILSVIGMGLAMLRVPVIALWMLAGVIRLCSLVPTIMSVLSRSFSGKVGTTAILISVLIGAPIFVYGSLNRVMEVRTLGMIACLSVSAIVCFVAYFFVSKPEDKTS